MLRSWRPVATLRRTAWFGLEPDSLGFIPTRQALPGARCAALGVAGATVPLSPVVGLKADPQRQEAMSA